MGTVADILWYELKNRMARMGPGEFNYPNDIHGISADDRKYANDVWGEGRGVARNAPAHNGQNRTLTPARKLIPACGNTKFSVIFPP